MIPSISSDLRAFIWIIVGISSLFFAILTIVLEKNIVYSIRKIGRPPTRKPWFIWTFYWLSTFVLVIGTAVASSAPESTQSNQVTPTKSPIDFVSETPTSLPESTTISLDLDWLYPRAVPWNFSLCQDQYDWTMAFKDAGNSNYSCEFLPPPLIPGWEMQGDAEFTLPIIVDNIVYLSDSNGLVYALNLSDGKVVWNTQSSPLSVNGNMQSLAYNNGMVYLATGAGIIYAFDVIDGSIKWTYVSDASFNSSPLIYDNKLVVGNESGDLFSINAITGDLFWVENFGEIYASKAAAWEGKLYIVSRNGEIFCIDAMSGEVIWERGIGGTSNGKTPVIESNIIYVFGSRLFALDANTGEIIWSQALKSFFEVNSLTVDEYFVYIPSVSDNKIVALDKSTGETKWEAKLQGTPAPFGPVISSLYLYQRISTRSEDIFVILNKLTGDILWENELPSDTTMATFPNLILYNQSLLVTTEDNKILTFRSTPGKILVVNNHEIQIWDPFFNTTKKYQTDIELRDCNVSFNDGELICVGLVENRLDLYTLKLENGIFKKITDLNIPVDEYVLTSFSKNSHKVAVSLGSGFIGSGNIDHGRLIIIDSKESKQTLVTDEFCGAEDSLIWSPDSNWLVYSECIGPDPHPSTDAMVKVSSDGTLKHVIGSHANWIDYSWSPDGLWIAFSDDDGLTIVTPDGKIKYLISQLAGHSGWSPSSQWLGFEPWVDNGTGIYIIESDGSNGRWVTEFSGHIYPGYTPFSWSVDSKNIAYIDRDLQGYKVNIINAKNGDQINSLFLGESILGLNILKWIP